MIVSQGDIVRSLTRSQMREFDRLAIEEYGVPGVVLMENAARGVVDVLLAVDPVPAGVLILCARGNNGGDGFVIARHLEARGVPVLVALFAEPDSLAGDAEVNFRILEHAGTPASVLTDEEGVDRFLTETLPAAIGWVVDALFGTGFTGSLRPPFDRLVERLNGLGTVRVLSVDVPSGLDCDTGDAAGGAVCAERTVTFVAPKPGLLAPEAGRYVGQLHTVGVGAPAALLRRFGLSG